MQRVADHRFLYQREGAYYFRRGVPQDVRSAFDGAREVKISLHTRSLSEARLRAAQHLATFEHRLKKARGASGHRSAPAMPPIEPTRDEMEAGVRQWLSDRVQEASPSFAGPAGAEVDEVARRLSLSDYEKAIKRGLVSRQLPVMTEWLAEKLAADHRWAVQKGTAAWLSLCDVVARGEIEFARRAADQLDFVDGRVHSPMFAPERYEADQQRGRASGITLTAAIDAFLSDPSLSANEKTKAKYRNQLETMAEALGPTRRIRTITREECRQLRDDVVIKLPRHRSLKFKGKSVREAVAEVEKRGGAIIDAETQNSMLDKLQALFEWAVSYEHRSDNPARDLRVAVVKEKKRRPFTAGELTRIFHAPLFTGCRDDENGYAKPGPNHPRGHRFWLPLVGLFTGMRLDEICQLRTTDLEEVEGAWVIHVRSDLAAGKTLKTLSSARRVPVHPELIRIGFDRYARGIKSEWLFPGIDHAGHDRGTDAISKWFARFLNGLGIKDRGAVFHSFRHGFRDALREGGVSEEVALALGGWTDHKVGNRYGAGHSLSSLRQGIGRLMFPGLDLSHLQPPTA